MVVSNCFGVVMMFMFVSCCVSVVCSCVLLLGLLYCSVSWLGFLFCVMILCSVFWIIGRFNYLVGSVFRFGVVWVLVWNMLWISVVVLNGWFVVCVGSVGVDWFCVSVGL